jgi:hypothetical protein
MMTAKQAALLHLKIRLGQHYIFAQRIDGLLKTHL